MAHAAKQLQMALKRFLVYDFLRCDVLRPASLREALVRPTDGPYMRP